MRVPWAKVTRDDLVIVIQYTPKHLNYKREIGKVISNSKGIVRVACSKVSLSSKPIEFNTMGDEIVATNAIKAECRLRLEPLTQEEYESHTRVMMASKLSRVNFNKLPFDELVKVYGLLKKY